MAKRCRLDLLLVERGLTKTREQARALVLAGGVRVNGEAAGKSGTTVLETAEVEIVGQDHPYASRGGLKLEKAFHAFQVNPQGWIALDVGASTGGFTDCLLQHGAAKVYAVDVGYGQLAWKLRQNDQVVVLERTNFRHLAYETIGETVSLVVIDASFISLKLLLPKVRKFLAPEGQVLALVKPQFEAGRTEVGKRGHVAEGEVHERVLDELGTTAEALGFRTLGQYESPILGKKSGNREFFLHLALANSGAERAC
ncbi:MAG: TlyA family rRNA (cytidine-2'-O)-methyltransferase [Deltaproteobacteria bacterium]|jgi:23S rRNA (cytidine1920-2'-O)/16S rRNA (cytidine1409-2'-O)-methyltransferase|nr:TlyA family rRNA (cytidine-2'-O)-methyltransferase [Deltaproteobacteria bacterium]MDP7158766.1 TlyA family RNA methyltransferase [SAR324 cluster bacterium]MDP7316786.1 TlyA family RNA methyltransferase [SAR324 cluster bacterium]MDP7463436.1 TlyA family RNA methyltransferase [SAR324 cluster bacterium]MDP7629723.1 TlyA family RNA methyltransferase [SAR324 cluster bacterium]